MSFCTSDYYKFKDFSTGDSVVYYHTFLEQKFYGIIVEIYSDLLYIHWEGNEVKTQFTIDELQDKANSQAAIFCKSKDYKKFKNKMKGSE